MAQLTQDEPEGWKMMPNFKINYEHFNFLGLVFRQKEATATMIEKPNFLVEVQTKMYYGLITMARIFRKYGQVENIAVHLQNTPTLFLFLFSFLQAFKSFFFHHQVHK